MEINFHQNNELTPNQIKVDVSSKELSPEVIKLIHKLESYNHTANILPIHTNEQTIMIKMNNIIMIEVLKRNVTITTINDQYQTHKSLKDIKFQLNNDIFVQISKFAIINLNHLQSMEAAFSGNMTAFLTNNYKATVSRRYLKNLKQKLEL